MSKNQPTTRARFVKYAPKQNPIRYVARISDRERVRENQFRRVLITYSNNTLIHAVGVFIFPTNRTYFNSKKRTDSVGLARV